MTDMVKETIEIKKSEDCPRELCSVFCCWSKH